MQILTNWNSVAAPAPASAFLSAPAGKKEKAILSNYKAKTIHCFGLEDELLFRIC